MDRRPAVLFLIPHLGGGGAERVTARVLRGISDLKYDVHLGLVAQPGRGSEELPAWVQVHSIGASRIRFAVWGLLRLVQRVKPAVIVSGMAHLNFLVLLLRPFFPRETRVLIRQNGVIAPSAAEQPAWSTRLLYRNLYPRADGIICQTEAMRTELALLLGAAEKLYVIPNPVDIGRIRSIVAAGDDDLYTGPGPHLLAVGRLAREKGFDLLLEAFASIRGAFPTADLTILGAGPEEAALKQLCRRLKLAEAVRLMDYVEGPERWLAGADLFVMSSYHEALPNALLEAAAAGLPLVCLPAVGGVPALLRGQPGAWLAKDISAAALSEVLMAALSEIRPRERFAHAWVETFDKDAVVARYERLIDDTLSAKR